MPSITDVVNAAVPAGMTLAQWLASRNSLNAATNTVNQGATAAAAGLNTAANAAQAGQKAALGQQQTIATGNVNRTDAATRAAIAAQQAALAKQQGLYQNTIDANAPYAAFGNQSIAQLQALQANPSSITTDPAYQFELQQEQQAQERAAAARGTIGNGGQVRAATRLALDYAATKYQDAWNRLMQATGVGQQANAANAAAGVTFGGQIGNEANNESNVITGGAAQNNATMGNLSNQIGQNATTVGNIGTSNAENQAALTIAQAQLAAKNQALQGNNTTSTLQALTPTIAQAAKTIIPAVLGGGTTAGAVAAPTIQSIIGTLPGMAAPGTTALSAIAGGAVPEISSSAIGLGSLPAAPGLLGTGGATVSTGTAATGGLGSIASSAIHALGALASNPITWGVAAAIGGALIWKSTQVHPTADKWVQGYQNPFDKHMDEITQEFRKAIDSGQMTREQAQAARDQAAGFAAAYLQDLNDFRAKGSKEKIVADQAQATLDKYYGKDFSTWLGWWDGQIANLPETQAVA